MWDRMSLALKRALSAYLTVLVDANGIYPFDVNVVKL